MTNILEKKFINEKLGIELTTSIFNNIGNL